jgi:carbamoyl-phosphate synthase large subunit
MREAVKVSNDSPVLLDRFLDDAIEVDVDCVADGQDVVIGGVMEHVEQAGIHSGDSACCLPPYSLADATVAEIKRQTQRLARGLHVVGLMNVQFAVQRVRIDGHVHDRIYVLEVNPRASRTVPFVSKATGRQLARIAARCMAGQTLAEQGIRGEVVPPYYSVKESVLPFAKFPGVDCILGPEMKSTGEVMGTGATFGEAFLKAAMGAGVRLPAQGYVYLRVRKADQARAVALARRLHEAGFALCASDVTAAVIKAGDVPVCVIDDDTLLGMLALREIAMTVITVPERRTAVAASRKLRLAALASGTVILTTIAAAEATAEAVRHIGRCGLYSLQELHAYEGMPRDAGAGRLAPEQRDYAAAAVELPERRTRQRERSVGVAPLKLFIRQPFTESDEREQRMIAEILVLIDSANGLPHPFEYLTGTQAESADTFRQSFERRQGIPFTPKNFRQHRLALLEQADALVNIRVGMSESSAFELSYHIFKGRRTPILFLVWKGAPIKTTLLRELDDLCDVTYIEFDEVAELRGGLHRFFAAISPEGVRNVR